MLKSAINKESKEALVAFVDELEDIINDFDEQRVSEDEVWDMLSRYVKVWNTQQWWGTFSCWYEHSLHWWPCKSTNYQELHYVN